MGKQEREEEGKKVLSCTINQVEVPNNGLISADLEAFLLPSALREEKVISLSKLWRKKCKTVRILIKALKRAGAGTERTLCAPNSTRQRIHHHDNNRKETAAGLCVPASKRNWKVIHYCCNSCQLIDKLLPLCRIFSVFVQNFPRKSPKPESTT